MKILIIEDNVQLSELTKMALMKYNYEIVICNDASDGINSVQLHQPDLILIDIIMPGMSGPEIVKSLKMDQECKNIPVVFISGLMAEDDKSLKEEGLKIDGFNYPILSKPYKSEQLLSMVKKYAKVE